MKLPVRFFLFHLLATPAVGSAQCNDGWMQEDASLLQSQTLLSQSKAGSLASETAPCDATIFIIRHAERNDADFVACLNDTGLIRAGNLSAVFQTRRSPGKIFAYNYSALQSHFGIPQNTFCERCAETALPITTALGQTMNHSFPANYLSNSDAAWAMLEALDVTEGAPVLAVWESGSAQFLLRDLGVPMPPAWPSDDCELAYNRIYKVNFKKVSKASGWKFQSYENLTQGAPCLPARLNDTAKAVNLSYPFRVPKLNLSSANFSQVVPLMNG